MCEGYEGWKNYQTWTVPLVLNNDEGTHLAAREVAHEAYSSWEPNRLLAKFYADPEDGPARRASAATAEAADALRDWVVEACEDWHADHGDDPFGMIVSQLVGHALEQVDWFHVAEAFLEGVEEEEQE